MLGPNNGAVKLIGPDGFTGYPDCCRHAGGPGHVHLVRRPARFGELVKAGGAGAKFVDRLQGQVRT